MSIKLMSMIFEVKGQLSPTEKLVLLELADHANDLGGGIWPGWDTIMDRTSLKRSAVRDTLDFLTEVGLLHTVAEPTVKTSTRREINVHLLQELVDLGNRNQEHPVILMARAIRDRKREEQKAKREGNDAPVSPDDTGQEMNGGRQTTQGVSPNDTAVSADDIAVSPNDTESLINLSLKHKRIGNDIPPAASPEGELPAGIAIPGDCDPDPADMLAAVKDQLYTEMDRMDYRRYVEPLALVGWMNGTFRVSIPDHRARDWVQSRLGRQINRMLTGYAMREVRLEVQLREPV